MIRCVSKIALIDDDNKIYLENNKSIGKISFFWWEKEWNEKPVETLKRELYEELWISLEDDLIKFICIDWPKEFSKWTFIAYIYTYRVKKELYDILKNKNDVLIYNIEELLKVDNPESKLAFDLELIKNITKKLWAKL